MTESLNNHWRIKRPFRAWRRGFVTLSFLLTVAMPFMGHQPSKWLFLLLGFGYSALLSFFAVGLCLVPGPAWKRLVFPLLCMKALCFTSFAGVVYFAKADILSLLPTFSSAVALIGIIYAALTLYGWHCWFTRERAKST